MIIILSGVSGVGKTTIAELMQSNHDFVRSVSYTSRTPRHGEINHKDYVFISAAEFEKKIAQNFFIEYVHQFDNFYGTAYEQIDALLKSNKKIVMCLTKEGFKVANEKWPKLTLGIYLLPPDDLTLQKRLYERDDKPSQKDLTLRITEKCKEEDYEGYHHILPPDTIENTLKNILALLNKNLNNINLF